jgi:hypothetical protein
MPRPRATEPRDQQVLVRLTARELGVLEAVAHLERTKPNLYVREILVEHLVAMVRNPRVQADLANRAAYDADERVASPIRKRAGAASKAASTAVKPSSRTRNTS